MSIYKQLFIALFSLYCVTAISQVTSNSYYVSTNGDDGNNGLSEDQAWRTISKVNATTFVPGDIIHFNRGDEWREQLTIYQSGTEDNPIRFTSYGTGDLPILNGANVITEWADEGSNVWSANCPASMNGNAYMVSVNDVLFTHVAEKSSVISASRYFVDYTTTPDRVYIYATVDPGTVVSEVSGRKYAIVSNQLFLSISNIEVRNAGASGIYLHHDNVYVNSGSIINGVTAYRNRISGIGFGQSYGGVTVTNCKATYNGNGIVGWEGGDNSVISNCYTSNSIHDYITDVWYSDGSGIQLYKCDNAIIENCETDGDPYGIVLDPRGTSNSMICRYNYVHDSPSIGVNAGIGVYGEITGGTIQIYYNLVVNCGSSEGAAFMTFSGPATGNVYMYNNTIVMDVAHRGYGMDVLIAHPDNYVIKNNIFVADYKANHRFYLFSNDGTFNSDNNLFFQYDKGFEPIEFTFPADINYSELSDWISAVNQDANSLSEDPLFLNNLGDYRLRANSPAIDKGTNVGLTKDILGNPIVGLPDLGAFEYVAGEPPPPPIPINTGIDFDEAYPTIIELYFDYAINSQIVPSVNNFTVRLNGTTNFDVASISISEFVVRLTLENPVNASGTLSVSYSKSGSNILQTWAGGEVESFTAQTDINIEDPPPPPPPPSEEQLNVKIFLSPSGEYITIHILGEPMTTSYFIRFYDTSGQLIYEDKLITNASNIPINFSSGVYLVDIGLGNEILFSQNIILNK